MNCPYALRPGLAEPPKSMADLPIDTRGYPAPWFVEWINGQPEFRVTSRRNFMKAINEQLCWTCGQPMLGSERIFVIGPMCLVNRVSSEPASHRECAQYAAQNCPFLTKPQMVRRKDNLPDISSPAGIMVERNPGVTLLFYTRHYQLLNVRGRAGSGDGVLFKLGRPFRVEWYREGRTASRAEVLEGLESGLTILRETAAKNDGPEGMLLVEHQITTAMRLVPR